MDAINQIILSIDDEPNPVQYYGYIIANNTSTQY